MPKIPQYQQNQLASSLVGTPGVNPAAGDVAGAIAAGANQIEGNLRSLATVQYQEQQRALRAKQAEDRALARQQQAMMDDMDAAKAQYDMDRQIDLKMAQVKEQNLDNPDAAVQQMAQFGPEFITQYRDNMQYNDTVKAKAFTGSLNRFREQLGTMQNTWAGEQKVKAGLAKFESMADWTAVNIAKNAEGTEGMLSVPHSVEWMNNFSEISKAFAAIGVTDADVRKQTEKMAQNYLSRLSYEDPDKLTSVIKAGVFDDYIDGASRSKLYNDVEAHALARKRDLREEQQYTTAVTMAGTTQELRLGAMRGETTAADFQAARQAAIAAKASPSVIRSIDTIEAAQVGRDISDAEKKVNQMQKEEKKAAEKNRLLQEKQIIGNVRADLNAKMNSVLTKVTKGKSRGKTKFAADTSVDEISDLMANLTIAEVNGHIPAEKANAARNMLESALHLKNKKDPALVKYSRSVLNNIATMRKWALTASNDAKFNQNLSTKAISNLYSMTRQYHAKHGAWPNDAQMNNLRNDAYSAAGAWLRKQTGR